MRFGDGPRRRRMIRGMIVGIGELTMRYGHLSQLATLDCTSSRRSTVMRALPRATAVTTEYQRDSSSKRPRPSVASAARAPTGGDLDDSALTAGHSISVRKRTFPIRRVRQNPSDPFPARSHPVVLEHPRKRGARSRPLLAFARASRLRLSLRGTAGAPPSAHSAP